MADSTKDWPLPLRINDAAVRLASALYYANHEAYGGSGRHYEALEYAERHQWVKLAESVIKSQAPMPRGLVTHWHMPCVPSEFPAGDSFTKIPTEVTCRACVEMLRRWEAVAKAQ